MANDTLLHGLALIGGRDANDIKLGQQAIKPSQTFQMINNILQEQFDAAVIVIHHLQ